MIIAIPTAKKMACKNKEVDVVTDATNASSFSSKTSSLERASNAVSMQARHPASPLKALNFSLILFAR